MSRSQVNQIILIFIAVLTLISLVLSVQALSFGIVGARILELVVFALVTAFALVLSVPFARTELSIAHAIGLIALLSLPSDVIPAMTIAIFIGGLLGSAFRGTIRQEGRYTEAEWYMTTIYITGRVTLAYFAAATIYAGFFNAPLPINNNYDLGQNALALSAAILVYLIVYMLSFMAQVRSYLFVRTLIRDNIIPLSIILILPVPFAIIAANVAQTDISILFFAITILGTVLIIFGLYTLARSEQRLRRQLEEMTSLSVATQAMRGNLELNSLLRTTYVQVSQLLDTKNFTVALYDELENKMNFPLLIRNGEETKATSKEIVRDYSLLKHTIDDGASLLMSSDVKEQVRDLDLTITEDLPQSWLGAPLVVGDKAIGAFAVFADDQRRFNHNDLRVLNIIAASTSIAIENARLYRQKSRRAEQLATLNRVTALFTATLAPNEVLDVVVSSASTVAESNAVAIYLFTDDADRQLELTRSAGLSDAFLAKPARPLLAAKLENTEFDDYITPESLLIQNIDDKRATPVYDAMLQENKRAFIEHPLLFSGNAQGVMVLYYDKPQTYHPEQVNMIQAFATQAAQSINNAQRFASADRALERRVEQLYVLAAMGRLLNASMEMKQIYHIVLTYATDATKAPRGFIALYRPSGEISVLSQRGYPDDTFANPDYLVQGLSGQVLHSGQALRITDTRLETSYLPIIPQTRSLLVIPIMKGRDILGIISLESDMPHSFGEGDAHFVAQIANQAVIAVDNTRLFQRVREARDNMKVILDAMEEGIILIDEQGKVALANPQINLISLTADDILGQAISSLVKAENLQFAERLGFNNPEVLYKLIRHLRSRWQEYALHNYEIRSEDIGTRYIQRQIIPVLDDNQRVNGIMLVFYNKSEERELAIARESLSQMIVHDLRSPLTAVTTSLRLLQQLVPQDADFAPLVEKTTFTSRRAIRKVLTRVDSLLDVSKMESGEMNLQREATSIHQIVESVKNELKPLADELEVTMTTDIHDNLPLLDIDADKVERLVLNLVDNALKYSPANALVEIRVMMNTPEFSHLEVVDNGPGIPDDYKRRLFDRFAQIEGRQIVRRGVGLGLTFCKLVTEAHGGEIWVTDNPDGGSIFNVTLPISQQSALADL